MAGEDITKIRNTVLSLIESDFDSDAAFERVAGLKIKTVNNWRRGLSSSFMKMIPELAEIFHVSAAQILDMPMRPDTSELSEEELKIVHLYRKTRGLPKEARSAVMATIESVIGMYMTSTAKKTNR